MIGLIVLASFCVIPQPNEIRSLEGAPVPTNTPVVVRADATIAPEVYRLNVGGEFPGVVVLDGRGLEKRPLRLYISVVELVLLEIVVILPAEVRVFPLLLLVLLLQTSLLLNLEQKVGRCWQIKSLRGIGIILLSFLGITELRQSQIIECMDDFGIAQERHSSKEQLAIIDTVNLFCNRMLLADFK